LYNLHVKNPEKFELFEDVLNSKPGLTTFYHWGDELTGD